MPALVRSEQNTLEIEPFDFDVSGNERLSEQGVDLELLIRQSLGQTRMAIALTDPRRPGNPLVFVNQAFLMLTGYRRDEIIGRNCKFLQGPETDPAAVDKIRDAMEARKVKVIEILNYRKDGTAFWNSLHIGPIFNAEGELTNFYGSQWDVTDDVLRRRQLELERDISDELRHRTRNLFNVIGGIIRLSAREENDARALAKMIDDRVQALGRAHEVSIVDTSRSDRAPIDLKQLAEAILAPYRSTAFPDRIEVDGDRYEVPEGVFTPLGLVLHELATNALKHGALSRSGGRVALGWRRDETHLTVTWTESGGPRVAPPDSFGSGTRIAKGIVALIDATLDFDWAAGGLRATIRIPLSMR